MAQLPARPRGDTGIFLPPDMGRVPLLTWGLSLALRKEGEGRRVLALAVLFFKRL